MGSIRALARSFSSGPSFNHWRGGYASQLSDAGIDTVVQSVESAPPGWSIGIGHYMHGAVCRVEPAASALPRDCGGFSYFFNTSWFEEHQSERSMAWVDGSWERMRQYASASTINYLSEGTERAVEASYGDQYRRLVELKTRFDPENAFHLNRNIRPA